MRPYSEGGAFGSNFTPNKCHPYVEVSTDTPFVERSFGPENGDDWDPTEGDVRMKLDLQVSDNEAVMLLISFIIGLAALTGYLVML
jgi:hypothetical protein